MTTIRPGAPVTATDEYLAAILVELRGINAKLDQVVTTNPAVEHLTAEYDSMLIDPEPLSEAIEELLHPGRGVIV